MEKSKSMKNIKLQRCVITISCIFLIILILYTFDYAYKNINKVLTANKLQYFVLFIWLIVLLIIFFSIVFGLLSFSHYKKRIYHSVFIDELTGGENYEYLEKTFSIKKEKNSYLISLDIDDFNTFNLAYGMYKGDELLRYIYHTFKKETLTNRIYHKHSDYFVAIINADSKDILESKIKKFIYRVKMDISQGIIVPFSMAIGISKIKESLELAYEESLLAKNNVRKTDITYSFYDMKIKMEQLKNMRVNTAFEKAINNHEFEVYYQPKYNIQTKKIIGVEALIRWVKADGTLILPDEFIPSLELSGKIVKLDEIVIEMVCSQMQEMLQDKLKIKKVSINLSRIELKRPNLIFNKINQIINKYQLDPNFLSFEITESAFYRNEKSVIDLIDNLHQLGCQVELDDFGKGMSGLEILTKANFDTVKLDRYFLMDLDDYKITTTTKSIIEMVSNLKMNFIAEGVETLRQEQFLLSNNCVFAQGYLYSKPISKDAYLQLLKNEKA